MTRDFHAPGRSPVYAANAMVATSMPQASLAAIEMLRAGGNAMDAAVTASAVLAVVEPHSTGIGGDCFCLYKPKGKPVIALNGSGRAPAAAHLDALGLPNEAVMAETSPHSVTIPGAVAAWEMLLAAHGRKGLAEILQPAIHFAENGFVVPPRVAMDWAAEVEKLRSTNARGLLVNGEAPCIGSKFHQPALGSTLRKIARHGARAFYEGEIAEAIVSELRGRGGLHTVEDFAAGQTAAVFVDPVSGKFAGRDVWECPPNGSGIIALMIMGIMDRFQGSIDPLDPLRVHRHIEAARLAYRDRDMFLADPALEDVPVEHLLSEAYLSRLRDLIDDDRAMKALPSADVVHRNTVCLSVVDADGNVCSFINSLFDSFGSGIIAGNTGIVLHNRGLGFSLRHGHPNCIAPNKRPMHTIIPALATRNGEAELAFGVMGGHYQPMGQSYVSGNIFQYGLNPQDAIDLPRYFPSENRVELERGISPELQAALVAKGHDVVVLDRPHGGGQAVLIDHAEGVLIGASDPRKDGCALGY
jgi:gamma-glutamyltranspeptidase / glutathione hydrolase